MHIAKGDTLIALEMTLTLNGAAFPLIGGDVLKLRWSIGNPIDNPTSTRVEVTPTVVTPPGTDGKLKYDFTAGQTDVVGSYYGQVTVTRSGKAISFPDDGSYFLWFVHEKI